ncbi:hypothetical protein AB0L49_42355 [Streptomyces antimycoticus]|uniref:hypothetical protein n=1 Tax=Streptomyces antimycoticus TaxID=68175 RepID=UPI00344625EE
MAAHRAAPAQPVGPTNPRAAARRCRASSTPTALEKEDLLELAAAAGPLAAAALQLREQVEQPGVVVPE